MKPFAKASIERTSFLGSVSLNKLPSPDPPSNSRLNYFKGTFVILKNVYGDQLNLTGPAKNSEIIKRRTLFFKSKQSIGIKNICLVNLPFKINFSSVLSSEYSD